MKIPVFFIIFLNGFFFLNGPANATDTLREKDSPRPWVEVGIKRFQEKKYKGALSALKTALDKSPLCAEAYYWRGRSFEAMNKPLDAANEYRAALLAQEKYQEAQEALARVQLLLDSSDSN